MIENAQETLQPTEFAGVARGREFLYGFLKTHFLTLPSVNMVREIRSAGFDAFLASVIGNEDLNADVKVGATLMRGFLGSMAEVETAKVSDILRVDRTRLYRGVAPGYGPKPPYELEWRGGVGQGTAVLRQIADAYRQGGLAISEEARERLDYAGVELEFMQKLASSEAEQWETGIVGAAKETLGRQLGFFRQHLAAWLPLFLAQSLNHPRTDFYRGHLLMLRGFLAEEAERLPYLVNAKVAGPLD